MKPKEAHIRFPQPFGEVLTQYLTRNNIVVNQYVVSAVRKQLEKDLQKEKDLSTEKPL